MEKVNYCIDCKFCHGGYCFNINNAYLHEDGTIYLGYFVNGGIMAQRKMVNSEKCFACKYYEELDLPF